MILIEHLYKMQVNSHFFEGEKVRDSIFGGFCDCSGTMFQKMWFDLNGKSTLISECEKCWKNEAMIFDGSELTSREEIEVVDRRDFSSVLKSILSNSEYEALNSKWQSRDYNYNAYSRAKKKLNEVGLSPEEVTSYI
ncbi:MAG: hypothetical protein R6U44_00720 [Archaeoglobaceae archaeon]